MENANLNRNFTISSKVSATQKAKYIQEAKKNNLPLSEWICSILDLALKVYQDVNKFEDLKQLQKEIDKKIIMINSLDLVLEEKWRIYDDLLLCVDINEKIIVQHSDTIKKLKKRIHRLEILTVQEVS